jgi:hypothetical protein
MILSYVRSRIPTCATPALSVAWSVGASVYDLVTFTNRSWQTGQATNRGRDIANWASDNDLNLLNTVHIPTTPYGNTIDLAFTNIPLAEATVEDHLATSSDPFTLCLTLPDGRLAPVQPVKVRVTTEDELKRFVETVEFEATGIPLADSTPAELDELASALVNLLT